MSKVISIINQKGGVGKTTTTASLGYGLVQRGYKVLLIDLDPQADLSLHLGVPSPDELENTVSDLILDVIKGELIDYSKYVLELDNNLYIIPSNIELASLETAMNDFFNKRYIVNSFLEDIKDIFDYVIIDCPPSLGIYTTNALAASDSVIIPTQAQAFSRRGITHLLDTIKNIRRYNKNLHVEGILITQMQSDTMAAKAVRERIKSNYGDRVKIFDTTIPRSVVAEKAAFMGVAIQSFSKDNSVSVAYEKFIDEVIKNEI